MRVLLQNTETKLYFICADEWTDDPSQATDFQEIQNAAAAYDSEDLAYARIVVEPAGAAAAALAFAEIFKRARATA